MLTFSSVLFIATYLLGTPKDSYEFQQRKGQIDAIRFESAFLLWSALDDSTRLNYYSETVGGSVAATNGFAAFKAQKTAEIKEGQRVVGSLEARKAAIHSDAADKSYVSVETSTTAIVADGRDAVGVSLSDTVSGYSQSKYNSLIAQEAPRLRSIDANIQANQQAIAERQGKIASSSSYSANAAAAAENEAGYIANLETAMQNGFKPCLRYRRLERFESSQPRTDETINAVFDNPGRVIVRADGKFQVTATNARTRKVTGIANGQPKYRHFCVVDPAPGDAFSIRIQSESNITVTVEELR